MRQCSLKDIPDNEIQITKNVLERILQNLGLEFVVESIPSCADFALGAPAMMGSLSEFTISNDIGNSAREKKSG